VTEEPTAAEAAAAHGQPETQWEAEHPPAEVTEQEASDYAARMPGAGVTAGNPAAEQAMGRERGGPAVAAETISTEPRPAEGVVDVDGPVDRPVTPPTGDLAAEHGTGEPATEGAPGRNAQEQ
jgi:hypothetical protein